MKKLRLLLAFCALLIGWSNASAQNPGDDMTSYITNPTFTGNADGWTITGDARYFNGKGFDGTASFIELTNWGSSWDATISQTVTVPNGYYRIKAAGQMSGTSDCWMKLVANGAESRFSRNGDTNGNILADGTETEIGSGVAGWRYTSVIAHVTNGSLEISCVGHSDVKERWANFDAVTLTFLGTEFAPNTDVTDYISNWDFWGCFNDEFNGWTIAKTGGNSWVHGNTAVEHWSNDMSRTFDFYQTINNLPEGRYQISASMWNTQGTPNGNSGVYGTSSNGTVFAGVTVDCDDSHLQTYTTNGIFVSDGTLRLGVKNNGERSTNWFGVDWIKLQYMGKVVQDYAVALPAGGAMVADTWYYFDIAVAGDEYNATATTLGDIICTDDGNTLTSAATGNVTLTATDNNFAVKRYYVKSSSANNLEIGVASYTYTVSEASVDKTYIQPSQTITVSFTASTNDPDATLTQNYSGVTFDGKQIDIVSGDKGFTFTVPANLTANTEYTLAIPAEAIGYASGSTYNAAQNITLKTPAVFDGVYYMYNTYTDNYLSRGGNYGTQAILDNYGMAVIVKTDANNATTVQYFDIARYLGDDGFCYADCSGGRIRTYNIASVDGGYKFLNTNNSKYLAVYENQAVGDAVEGDNLVGTSNVWSLESTTSHVANYTVNADAQVATATANITALSSITTKAALEAELASNYGKTSIAITGSKAEKYQVYATNANPSEEATYYSETVSGLTPGLYKLSVDAFQRAGQNANVAAADGARGLIYLYAGTAKTQLKSIMDASATSAYSNDFEYDGKHYPNNEASAYAALENCDYSNDVYVYVSADEDSETGSLEIGIKNPNYPGANNGCWAVYNNWTLTRYDAKATPAEKKALSDAITAAEAKTLGFEDKEYAPYNNVAAINALAAAKAIEPETASGEAVVAATSALTGATWTANDGEVNAICGGDFTKYETVGGQDLPYGWNLYNDGKNNSRIMGGTEGSSNTGLSATSSGKALLMKFNATYGETAGYTMPLKAGKIYKISFKYGGWSNNPNTIVSLTDPSDEAITLAPNFRPATNDAYSNAEHWYNYTGYFVSTTAGDYKLNFNKVESGQQQIVIADVELVSASELEFADGSVPTYAPGTYPSVKITRTLTANRWATAVYPFAINKSAVGEIAVLARYNSEADIIGFDNADNSTANVPFLMRSTTAKSEISLSNVAVAAASATDAEAGDASLVGSYANNTAVTEDAGNYILSNNTIYPVGENVKVNAYRAYINITGSTPARALRFVVGEITGVDNVEAATEATLKDGKYLENGKIVIVKNGQKFNANGQQVK